MPVLVFLTIGIAVYTLTLNGAGEGLKYNLLPDFDEFSLGKLIKTVVAAMGQPQAALSDAQIYMSDMYDHNIAYPVHYGYMMLIF